jgi:hypothetical protein
MIFLIACVPPILYFYSDKLKVMKKYLLVAGAFLCFTFSGYSQGLKDLDEVTPYQENYSAVRKGDKWAFINEIGAIVIDFRSDIVSGLSKHYPSNDPRKKIDHPYFSNDRCLVKIMKEGVSYFGYINKKGDVVISREYVNATPFVNGYAMVLKVEKEFLGTNKLLAKNMVSYSYDEVLIDLEGNVVMHLGGPNHLILSKEKLRKPPKINSYFLTENLLVIRNEDNKWDIKIL